MASANHMPPMLGAILADHDQGPEYAFVECIGENFTCSAKQTIENSFGLTDEQITKILAIYGWSVSPTLCPAHQHERGGE